MIFWRRTSAEAARAAVAGEGFVDGRGNYLTADEHTGVWVSDWPVDINEGAHGDTIVRIDVDATEEDFANFEWIEEEKPYREWLIPAALLNPRLRSVTIVPEDELPMKEEDDADEFAQVPFADLLRKKHTVVEVPQRAPLTFKKPERKMTKGAGCGRLH